MKIVNYLSSIKPHPGRKLGINFPGLSLGNTNQLSLLKEDRNSSQSTRHDGKQKGNLGFDARVSQLKFSWRKRRNEDGQSASHFI